MQAMTYAIFDTDKGWVGILASVSGLVRTTLPWPTPDEALADLGLKAGGIDPDILRLRDPIDRIRAYFQGKEIEFPDVLDYESSTPFQKRVWEATRRIPYGDTRSYADIAREVGVPLAARAVGRALSANPLPIVVPCHRVIASNGGLGGFGGGLKMKGELLKMEGASTASRPR